MARPDEQRPAQSSATDGRAFINKMAEAGNAEVMLGKMATERGQSSDVKSFGQMMVDDHSKANRELEQIASRLDITPMMELSQKHKDLQAKLSKLQGAEFDREYIAAMATGHEDVASALREYAGVRGAGAVHGGGHGATEPAGSDRSSKTAADRPGGSDANRSTSGGEDPDEAALTKWAMQTLPTVEKHLAKAKEIQSRLK